MKITTTPVDLDNVQAVAAELRRMCSRVVRVGVAFSVFHKGAGRLPSPTSRTFTRGGNRAVAALTLLCLITQRAQPP